MPTPGQPWSNGHQRPPSEPDAESAAREEERRFLIKLALWFLICAFLGASLLVVSIWVDWV